MFFNCRNRAFNACRHLGGGGALYSHLNDSSHASTPHSQGGPQAAQNNANNAQNGAFSPQEQLLNGTIKFDPENDPVVFTTDYGLDIKWHMAGEYTGTINNTLESGVKFAGYAYITAGGVNWAIIGVANENVNVKISAGWAFESDNTPASNAVKDDVSKGKIISANTMSELFPNAVPSDELEAGEVLCFAQNSFSATSKFNDSISAGNCYYNSRLMSTMNDFYDKNLTDLHIVEKTLKTVWAGASDTTKGSNLPETYKIFPLAGANANESFYVLNYLVSGSDAMKQSAYWWLRSGGASYSNCAYFVHSVGSLRYDNDYTVTRSYGVRPAFVLQL